MSETVVTPNDDAAPNARAPHLAILASAGSGKTFQLTNRMLHLLLSGVRPDSIFASTFTRMAAGEIRDRVVQRLTAAARSDEAAAKLAKELEASKMRLPNLSRRQVVDVLREIARRPQRLGVRTLDSFFAGIVRGYAVELGLPTDLDFAAEEDLEDIRQRALERLLNENEPQKLITWMRAITEGASDRSVLRLLDSKVAKLLALWRQTTADQWRLVERRAVLTQSQLADALIALGELTVENFEGHSQAGGEHSKRIDAAFNQHWDVWLAKGVAKAIVENAGLFHKKPIPAHVVDRYLPVIEHAQGTLVNRFIGRVEATLELLARLDQAERNLKRDQGLITFEDLTRSLLEAQLTGAFEHVCFRLDQRLEHLLLDEFQDTSAEQYRVLEPMIDEVTAHGDGSRTFFCVGDVKQSIYGWRGADPELLRRLAADPARDIHPQRLDKSWRSSPVIMKTANRVFEPRFEGLIFEEKAANGAGRFAELFTKHTTAKEHLPGYAELSVFDCDESELNGQGNAPPSVMARLTIDRVAELHERAPHLRIGVLTRSNKAVAHLLFECSAARRNLPAGGRGGGALTDAPAVNALLDAVRMADHPDDTVAAFHVARSPLGPALNFTDERDGRRRRALAARIRQRLLNDGYASTIQRWTRLIADACDARELARLHALIQRAAMFDEQATLRPIDFVRRAEAARAPDAERSPIELMTVHQSKGLEFDIVVLPELGGRLCGRDAEAAYRRDEQAGPIVQAAPWVNQDLRKLLPELDPLFDQHYDRVVRESLCLLYVAMTRAKLGLVMMMDRPTKKHLESGEISQIDHVLRMTLGPDVEPDHGAVLFREGDLEAVLAHGRDGASGGEAAEARAEAGQFDARPRLRPARSDGDGALLRSRAGAARPASHALDERDHAAALDRLRLLDDGAIDRGSAVHALFEAVDWLDGDESASNALDDRAMHERLAAIAPRRSDAWRRETIDLFRQSLVSPEVAAALSKPPISPGHSLDVAHELPYARSAEGRIQRGYIDRLVIERDGAGRPVRAEIIDFKTDAINPDDEAALMRATEHHRPQIEAYRAVVRALHHLADEAIAMRLIFVRPRRAVTLGPSPSRTPGA